jgi:hypothetical protein
MSETWYRTVSWGTRIDTVEILSHTDKTVTIKYGANGTHRRNLRSSFENYFATWEEAWQFLLSKATHDVDTARVRLKAQLEHLEKVQAMKAGESQ